MPTSNSAKKRIRSDARKRGRNRVRKSRIHTLRKKLIARLAEGDLEAARDALSQCFSELDKAAKKGLIHKRKADRVKSRLRRRLAAAESEDQTSGAEEVS